MSVAEKITAQMQSFDWIGPSVIVAFGLWWLFFPVSVPTFYAWFLGSYYSPRQLPRTPVNRIIGGAWLILVAVVWAVST
jgi:hypothetical protein